MWLSYGRCLCEVTWTAIISLIRKTIHQLDLPGLFHSLILWDSAVAPDLPGQPGLCATILGTWKTPHYRLSYLILLLPIWHHLRAPMIKEQDTSPKTDPPVHVITTLYSQPLLFYIRDFLKIRYRVSVLSSLLLCSIIYHS